MADWHDAVAREFGRQPLTVKRAVMLAGVAANEGRRNDAIRLISIAYELLDIAATKAPSSADTD
ncbi:hypothetical protein [Acidisphaera sp. L21]|uniref:hypothetical protein n=1 Tax=Acidisphaera sp. L21 TaxID=1641851 RepID=UPI00131D30B7|nr:hypothetical protein [Acidisphaera sp. L21]